jgi:hypothetical protein
MKIFLSLITIVIGFLFSDYQLDKYGRGYHIFNYRLPYGFELKLDEINQYKIVEDGFIHIVSSGQKIELEDSTVRNISKLLKYGVEDNILFVYINTEKGNENIKIYIDEKKPKGKQLVYSLCNDKNIKWIDLEENLKFLIISHFLFQILIIMILVKLYLNR